MRKLLILSLAAIFASSLFAETKIQHTFLGMTIGQTSKSEALSVMESQGFKFISGENSEGVVKYEFSGTYKHEGVEFHTVVTSFFSDTLVLFCPQDSCGAEKISEVSGTLQSNLERKYGHLEPADSTILYMTLTRSIDNYEIQKWSRMDDRTMLIYVKSDTKVACMYVDGKLYYKILLKGLERLNEALSEMPDYAEENKVYGVAGVKFGDDMATVKKAIAPKSNELTESDTHSLTFYKTKIGGNIYDFATFYFMEGQGLISVNLQRAFYSWKDEEAEMAYEGIVSQYKRKYSNFKVLVDERDEKMCTCGAYIDGYGYPPIVITFEKSLSKGGDIMYYVMVSYYEMRRANMYDDEI